MKSTPLPLLILLGTSIITSAQSEPGHTSVVRHDHTDGWSYALLEFEPEANKNYLLKRSDDLLNWEDAFRFTGGDEEFFWPMVALGPWDANAAPDPGLSDPAEAKPVVFGHLVHTATEGSYLGWSSIGGDGFLTVAIPGGINATEWEHHPVFSFDLPGQTVFMSVQTAAPWTLPADSPLGTDDAAFFVDFLAELPALEAQVTAMNLQSVSQGPFLPQTPPSGTRGYYKIQEDGWADTDGDGILDFLENRSIAEGGFGSNPYNPDTDGDLVWDGAEVTYGSNPNDGTSVPAQETCNAGTGLKRTDLDKAATPVTGFVSSVSFLENEKITSDAYVPGIDGSIGEFSVPLVEYRAPQWKICTQNFPVAYVKGRPITVSAKFVLDAEQPVVRATGPDGMVIPETPLVLEGGVWVLEKTAFEGTPYDVIRFFNVESSLKQWAIEWLWKDAADPDPDPVNPWQPAGITTHTLYITDAESKNFYDRYQETLYNIGCRNAEFLTTESDILAAIWSEFSDRSVARVKPASGSLRDEEMTYWGNPDCAENGTALLHFGDGSCSAWTRMMGMVMETQGLIPQMVALKAIPEVTVLPEWLGLAEFAVKNIYYNGNGFSTDAQGEFKYEWGLHLSEEQSATGPGLGIPGQGNDRPHKRFQYHAILGYKTKLYDPSYGGETYDNTDEGRELYETEKIDYFGEVVFLGPGGLKLWRKNPLGNQLMFDPRDGEQFR